jgi:YesN/AraC family two-component response regulator
VRLATNTTEAGASLLINYEEPDTEQRLMTVLYQYLASQCEYEPLFGISHACDLVNSLPVCYEGAKHAVEYHFLLPGKNTFKQQEADDWDEKPVVVDITLYTQLERAIKSADFSAAKGSLEIIFDILTREVYRLESVKSELSLLYKLLADKHRVFAFEQNMPVQALFMQEAQDIDQAKTAIIVGCEKYCMERQVQMSNRLVDDIERIKAYIVESVNAFDMEKLTLSEVARQFGKNPNYLSSLFPEYAGQNFRDFVTKVKLEKAAQELSKPGAVIYNVANSLGYYNVSYFIRIFKAMYGCTPGQYSEQRMRKRGVAQ